MARNREAVVSTATPRPASSRALLACLLVLWGPASQTAQAGGGQVQLTVVERGGGQPIPCRMHLKNAAAKPFKPGKVPFWNDHFVFPGKILLQLPRGNYQFELERGPEYPVVYGHFEIQDFADDAKVVELQRHVDMSANGWWSGDLDVCRPLSDIELLMAAEDLHVAQVLTWFNARSQWAGKPPQNPLVCFDRNRCYHRMAGGHARAGGTLLYFNLPAPLLLVGASPEHPSPVESLLQARQHPDAWVDATRPFWWDLPMLVAVGQIDSVELAYRQMCRDRVISSEGEGKPRDKFYFPDPWGNAQWSQQIYYHLLECGLRIPPTAGSGSGEAPNPVGYNRLYVHVEGEFSYEKWWQNLRAGRVTVTNGPLLQPSVEGQPPGHVFQAEEGQPLELEIGLTLSTREPISYLEIVKNGRAEHSIPFAEYAQSGRLPKLRFEQSGWFLIRAVTNLQTTYRFAMTGPYYVQIGYQPRISKKSAQFFVDWVLQRVGRIKLEDSSQRQEVLQYHRKAQAFWQDRLARANAE